MIFKEGSMGAEPGLSGVMRTAVGRTREGCCSRGIGEALRPIMEDSLKWNYTLVELADDAMEDGSGHMEGIMMMTKCILRFLTALALAADLAAQMQKIGGTTIHGVRRILRWMVIIDLGEDRRLFGKPQVHALWNASHCVVCLPSACTVRFSLLTIGN